MQHSFKDSFFKKILDSGTDPEVSLDDLRRIRLVNVLALASMILTPCMFFYNWGIGNVQELFPLGFFLVSFIIIFFINKRNNQWASCILLLVSITTSWWVMAVSSTQVGAPYFNILFGLLAIYLIKNHLLRNFLTLLAFTSFAILNWYQLMHRPFAMAEYGPIVVLLIVLYVAAVSYDNNYQRNEKIVKEQAVDLIKLNQIKHKQELLLKQKDIDTVMANNSMLLKIKEQMLTQLNDVKEGVEGQKKLRSIRLELKSQINTQKKLEFSQENLEAVNAEFYGRLYEQFPSLNKRDVELCSYIRLGLTARETADLLGSTENSIYVTKNRLRSKLQLPRESDLNTFLVNF